MTGKLFYEDSHMKEFEARVLSCEACEEGGGFWTVLDQTCFFPEGGGQYADTGYLGETKVVDARERDGIVYHRTEAPLEPGELVRGRIDWEERFEKMQQHTGEHIVSGLVHSRFGYNNVGFHLGSDYCTMDFDGPISPEELREIEWEANRAVALDLEVIVQYPSKEELGHMEYRSKIEIEGQVRIVSVPGYDVCACCAPHVDRTGEIGLIKLVNRMNYKGGERITMLCGFRALRDYDSKLTAAREIGALLCEKEDQIAGAVRRQKEELEKQKYENGRLMHQLLVFRAKEIPVEGLMTAVFTDDIRGDVPRELMNLLLERGAFICGVFAAAGDGGWRYVIGSRQADVRPLGKALNSRFEGRGGGKPGMVQGTLTGSEADIRAAAEGFIKGSGTEKGTE
nr:alanyl-tRNA editing protein [uncultured Lachnoclostridium sp.]